MTDTDQALRQHHPTAGASVESIRALHDLLQPQRRTQIVDIGANPIDGDPPYAPLLASGVVDVIGFEPQPAALARLHNLAGPHERYLPAAIGDGHEHELRICASDGFSGLLEPDHAQLELLTDFAALARVTRREKVQTTRLDDLALTHVDLLKIDVQGGEQAVFAGAQRTLPTTLAVQTEVGFHRLYEGAPTLADVDAQLRGAGLIPHALISSRTWPLAPVQWADPLQRRARHLVEADLLYVADLTRLRERDSESLRHLALIAHGAYESYGVSLLCLLELTRRGELPQDSESRYRLILGSLDDSAT